MAVTETYYRERAEEARTQAAEADLVNVRERCLRAAAAWDVMAARIGRTTRQRAANEARKAAEQAAAPLPAAPSPATV